MIGLVRGDLVYTAADEVIVEAAGVGYLISVSRLTANSLPALNQEVRLWVTTRVKDDAIQLFGFVDRREQSMFLNLLKVTGVGPKLALGIISFGSLEQLQSAIVSQDNEALAGIPGVGKKLSRRLALELGEILKKELDGSDGGLSSMTGQPAVAGLLDDLKAALLGLGYREREFGSLALKLVNENPSADLEALLKRVLRELHNGI